MKPMTLVLCLTIIGIEKVTSTSPQFTIQPSHDIVAEGGKAILNCQATGTPQPSITWYKDDAMAPTVGKYNVSANNSLQITSFSMTDAAQYVCIAANTDGSVRSQNATLTLAYIVPPQVTQTADNFREYQYKLLSCLVPTSVPPASVNWYRSSTLVVPNDRISVTLSHGLFFSYMIPQDQSNWRCSVANSVAQQIEHDSNSYILNLDANSLPPTQFAQIRLPPQPVTVSAGGTARFGCFASGHPLPTYTWLRNGNELTSSGRILLTQNNRVLTISNVESSDGGIYTCSISQTMLNMPEPVVSTAPAPLTVIEPPTISSSFPATTQSASLTATMECSVDGSLPINWTWRNNTALVQASSRITISSLLTTTSLTISNLDVSDGGVFQCIASNSVGRTASNNLLTIETSAPMFTEMPMDSLALVNTTLVLPCVATGHPFPTISWEVFNSPIQLGPNVQQSTEPLSRTLTISPVLIGNGGTYRCILNNGIGSPVVATAIVQVIDTPTVVASPVDTIVTIGNDITIQCSITVNAVPTSTTNRWTKDNVPIDINDPRKLIEDGNLKIQQFMSSDRGKYECTTEISVSGHSSAPVFWTVGSAFYTEVDPMPPSAPLNLMLQPPTSTHRLQLSWITPLESGGLDILEYIVNVNTLGRDNCIFDVESNYTHQASGGMQQVSEIGPLHPYSRHQVRVFARNSKSIGVTSDSSAVFWSLEDSPSGAPMTVSAAQGEEVGEIEVSWQPPPCMEANGEITGYDIQYQLSDLGFTAPFTVSTMSLHHTIRDLSVLVDYDIKVAAKTGIGRGPFSDTVTATTNKANPPGPPLSIMGEVDDDYSMVLLSWMAPMVQPQSPLTTVSFYTVTVLIANNVTSVIVTSATNLTYNLTVGTMYQFTVTANNSFGMGPPATYNLTTPFPTVKPFYEEVWFIPSVAVGGSLVVMVTLIILIIICCVCCKRKFHHADVKSLGRSSATYGRPSSFIDVAVRVRNHSSGSSSSGSSRSITPDPAYQEPSDTLRRTVRQNGTLNSRFKYLSPMEREQEAVKQMIEGKHPFDGRIMPVVPIELRTRHRSFSDSLPDTPVNDEDNIPTSGVHMAPTEASVRSPVNFEEGDDDVDYHWSPPAQGAITNQDASYSTPQDNRLQKHHSQRRHKQHRGDHCHSNSDGNLKPHVPHAAQQQNDATWHHGDRGRATRPSDITRHHSDRTHHQTRSNSSGRGRHHSEQQVKVDKRSYKVETTRHNSSTNHVTNMPCPHSPPHDHLNPIQNFQTDYPVSPKKQAPPFHPPPSVHTRHTESPTASVSSFVYQCLSPFELSKLNQQQNNHIHSSPQRPHPGSTMPSRAPHRLSHLPRTRTGTAPSLHTPRTSTGPSSQRHTHLPDVTRQAIAATSSEDNFHEPHTTSNIHRQPTKLAEEEEKRIMREKLNIRRLERYNAGRQRQVRIPTFAVRQQYFDNEEESTFV